MDVRSDLQGSGVSLIDTPKSGRKNATDFMLAADMLAFAIDVPAPARVFLISGDRDFAYALGILRYRGYDVILFVPPWGVAPVLEASANNTLQWREDVLKVTRFSAEATNNDSPESGIVAAPQGQSAQSTTTLVSTSIQSLASKVHLDGTLSCDASQTSSPTAIASSSAQPSTPQASEHQSGSNPAISGPPTSKEKKEKLMSLAYATRIHFQIFASLIGVLRVLEKEGQPKPLRSVTERRLVAADRKVFEREGATRLGVTNWDAFAHLAQATGLVTLDSGDTPGSEWIQLQKKKKGKLGKHNFKVGIRTSHLRLLALSRRKHPS